MPTRKYIVKVEVTVYENDDDMQDVQALVFRTQTDDRSAAIRYGSAIHKYAISVALGDKIDDNASSAPQAFASFPKG